jgi:transcription antitermination factor NusA-like protein
MRGSRVQAVVQELQGEKIDIIPWSPDPATFIVNSLAPAEVTKVVLDDEGHRVEVVVPDDQLSLAIGREGQNARLAAKLTGWRIDIKSESQIKEMEARKIFADLPEEAAPAEVPAPPTDPGAQAAADTPAAGEPAAPQEPPQDRPVPVETTVSQDP